MKKDAVQQGAMSISYEERDVSAKVVLKFSRGDFVSAWCPQPVTSRVSFETLE